MRKTSKKLLLISLLTLIFTACSGEEAVEEVTEEPQVKEVEVFVVGKDQPELSLTRMVSLHLMQLLT